jgi:putative flippase GtrA
LQRTTLHALYEKYKDLIPYAVFGVITTIVNIVAYWFCAHPLGLGTIPSTIIAWFLAVFTAYVTNRRWVFHSEAHGAAAIIQECIAFFAARIATGVIDLGSMWLFVDVMHLDDVVIKTLANVVVIALNYIFSKFVIFKHPAR